MADSGLILVDIGEMQECCEIGIVKWEAKAEKIKANAIAGYRANYKGWKRFIIFGPRPVLTLKNEEIWSLILVRYRDAWRSAPNSYAVECAERYEEYLKISKDTATMEIYLTISEFKSIFKFKSKKDANTD